MDIRQQKQSYSASSILGRYADVIAELWDEDSPVFSYTFRKETRKEHRF